MRRDGWLAVAGVGLAATAAVPLHRIFTTTAWRPGVLATIVVATLLAAGMRRLGWAPPVAAVVSMVALVAFAARLHATTAGPWPTVSALGELLSLGREGFNDVRLQPAPTEPLPGLRLLLTGGIWVVAHVTHEALVRLRRPGVAITTSALLWFTALAVPITGVATWPNALPFFLAAGVVLLLEPDPDGSGWTHEDHVVRLSTGGVAMVGMAAIVGLLAPWALPGYGEPAWVDVSASTEPRGYQPIVDVGDRLNLPSPRDVLEVRSTASVYLRLAALDTFDGRTWRLGPPDVETFRPDPDELFRADGPLPPETEIRAGTVVDLSIEVLDLENIYVPLPYQVETVMGPDGASMFYSRQGGFVATGDVEDNELLGQTRVGVREGFAYDVRSVVPTPTYGDLAALGDVELPTGDPLVALPPGYQEFGTLADEIAAAAGATTMIDRVLAVQDHFIGPGSAFTYSTRVPGLRGDDALRQFLFEARTGYCEYFATAMAVMLRATGIPARVAVGFLPGQLTEQAPAPGDPATFVVSTTDAHAWVEVLFDGYGWIKMDPTPRSEGLPPSAEDLNPQPELVAPGPAEPTATPTTQPTGPDLPSERPTLDQEDVGGGLDGGLDANRGAPTWLVVLAVLLVLAVLTAGAVYGEPVLRRVLARPHQDPSADVLAAMRRILATADHLGIGRAPHQTLTEATLAWADGGLIDPEDAATFARLASTAAFGGGLDTDDARTMRALETRIVAGFHGAIDRRQRLVAPWHALLRRARSLVQRTRALVGR